MSRVLHSIKPLHPPMIPPAGAEPAGLTPNGQQLYRLKRRRSRAVPLIDPKTEERAWARALNGDLLYPRNKPEFYLEDLLFYLESEGNGNIRMIAHVPPSVEELAEQERQRKIRAMQVGLAEALVDSGVDPAQLIASLEQGTLPGQDGPTASAEEPAPEEVSYPQHQGFGNWLLSSGEIVKGKKDEALKAEAEVSEERREAFAAAQAEAKSNAEAVPEV